MVRFGTLSRASATVDITHIPAARSGGPAALALVAANVIWAGSAAASKAALPDVPPLTMACLRVAIALAVLLPLLAARRERPATGAGPALLGLTGVALFCACQNLGLEHADASTTALIGGTIPVLTAALAVPLLRERLDTRRLAGLVVSLAGACLTVVAGGGAGGGAGLACLLPLASAASFALYAALGRRVFSSGSALPVVAGSTRYGLLFLLPPTLLEVTTDGPATVTTESALLLLYLGACCSALAFVLCGYGLSRLEVGHGAVFGNLKPLVGVALAVTLLGEPLNGQLVTGGVLILLGVAIASPGRPRPLTRPPQPGSGRAPAPPRRPARSAAPRGYPAR